MKKFKLSKTAKKAVAIVLGGVGVLVAFFLAGKAILQHEVDKFVAEKQAATTETSATGESATAETAIEGIEANYSSAYDYLQLDDSGRYKGITAASVVSLPDDFEHIAVPQEELSAVQDEVNYNMEYLRMTYGELQAPQNGRTTVESGDIISFTYRATVEDSLFYLADGSSSEGSISEYVVGSGTLFDNLDEKILNRPANEPFETTVVVSSGSYGLDGNELTVQGKEANIQITITKIFVPVLTDDVITNCFSGYEQEGIGVTTIEEANSYFYDDISSEIIYEYTANYLVENSTIEQSAIDDVVNRQKQFLAAFYTIDAEANGYNSLDEYVASQEVEGIGTYEELFESSLEDITSYTKQELVCQAIAEKLEIVPSEMDIFTTTSMDMDSLREKYSVGYAAQSALADLVQEKIIRGATVSDIAE